MNFTEALELLKEGKQLSEEQYCHYYEMVELKLGEVPTPTILEIHIRGIIPRIDRVDKANFSNEQLLSDRWKIWDPKNI